VIAWNNKGLSLDALGRHEEAIECCDQALAIDPRDAMAWCGKAVSCEGAGRRREAMMSYRKFVEVAGPEYAEGVARVRRRLAELESRGP
jgi:Flp pilus assembly protein TadD